jgi:hypothetical protein
VPADAKLAEGVDEIGSAGDEIGKTDVSATVANAWPAFSSSGYECKLSAIAAG